MIILLLLIVVIAIWAISTRNSFVQKEVKVNESLSGIEVALTKRYDMLTKMMEVAKGYAKHEREVYAEVVNLRRGMSIAQMQEASAKMDDMMRSIQVTREAYPELKSDKVFVELQQGIADVEEHLQAARRLYNANVTSFNTAIRMFPASLMAGGRTPFAFFEAESHKREDVKMEF